MAVAVAVAGGQLLKPVHVAKLQAALHAGLVFKAKEETVLVEVIIYYLLSKIDMHFIIHNKRPAFRVIAIFIKRDFI